MPLLRTIAVAVCLTGLSGCASWLDNLRPADPARSAAGPVPVRDNLGRIKGYVQEGHSGDLVIRDQTFQPRGRVSRERDGSLTVRDTLNRPTARLRPSDHTGLRTVRDSQGRLKGYTRSRDGDTHVLDRTLRPRANVGMNLED